MQQTADTLRDSIFRTCSRRTGMRDYHVYRYRRNTEPIYRVAHYSPTITQLSHEARTRRGKTVANDGCKVQAWVDINTMSCVQMIPVRGAVKGGFHKRIPATMTHIGRALKSAHFTVNSIHLRWLRVGSSPTSGQFFLLIPRVKVVEGEGTAILYATPMGNVGTLHNRTVTGCETLRNFPRIHQRIRVSIQRRVDACVRADGGRVVYYANEQCNGIHSNTIQPAGHTLLINIFQFQPFGFHSSAHVAQKQTRRMVPAHQNSVPFGKTLLATRIRLKIPTLRTKRLQAQTCLDDAKDRIRTISSSLHELLLCCLNYIKAYTARSMKKNLLPVPGGFVCILRSHKYDVDNMLKEKNIDKSDKRSSWSARRNFTQFDNTHPVTAKTTHNSHGRLHAILIQRWSSELFSVTLSTLSDIFTCFCQSIGVTLGLRNSESQGEEVCTSSRLSKHDHVHLLLVDQTTHELCKCFTVQKTFVRAHRAHEHTLYLKTITFPDTLSPRNDRDCNPMRVASSWLVDEGVNGKMAGARRGKPVPWIYNGRCPAQRVGMRIRRPCAHIASLTCDPRHTLCPTYAGMYARDLILHSTELRRKHYNLRIPRRSDEALGVRVTVVRIAPSLLAPERATTYVADTAVVWGFTRGSPVSSCVSIPSLLNPHLVHFSGWPEMARVLQVRQPGPRDEVLRTDEREVRRVRSSAEMKGQGEREIPEKTRRPAALSDTITTYENP
ncbi:hypothetical protein PR048_030107 [Dryococelus australis]|uniref:Uncharacterized protein n=1 Tax=Dryococelus australis TaxID=614101 RepID=A0ABQ9G805_9NEOP|nr:hypothetical protein PR048_030107 [Dryococelus australis]